MKDLYFMLQAQVPQIIHRTSRSQDIQLHLVSSKASALCSVGSPQLSLSEPSLSVHKQSIATSLHSLPFSVSATQHLGDASGSGFTDYELDEVLSPSKDHVISLNIPSDNVILLDFAEIHSTISASSWSSGLLNTSSSFILLCLEQSKFVAVSSKDAIHRISSINQSELGLAGATVASADLASQISQVKSKEGLKKCTSCRKPVRLMGFYWKYGYLFCAVHHYSDKHNCLFDYRNAGQNAIAKANPIIVAEKLNKI
ncbi:Zinc finger A20 and AN1 domain-containing stress-associated protein 8 [Capsicum baccatum]|uniref:Zinc finger A20 and AN1 domain-containing stress-associated protein 8 n=1 Tax=Capsicum baccatum TaxID=33114 RepID=A0A2G2VAZ9_CAPBA|nr:Zinc finger A20 and AN1 domain-containing stress-associated protein 8 [Capsicum baccatum]